MKRKVIIITLLLCYFSLLTCNKIKKEMLVTTGEVSDITVVSADLSGAVVDLGENPVQHGHCYGNSPNLTINNSKTTLGKPIKGGFTSQLADLNPGTKYYFKAYITDGDETVYGVEKSFSTLAGSAPNAPVIGTATAGNQQAVITFTAPANNGGSAITGYTVTSNPGGLTGTGTASPITVTGLSNGTAYTFVVTATNIIGTGSPSSASNSVTPSTVPGAPTIGTATAGNQQAVITFTAPLNNGGSAITLYTVTSNPGGLTKTGTSSPITVTGLTNGTAYTFTLTATNANGIGPASTASNSITPVAATTVPGAPTIGTATAGNLQATITFTAPSNNGGSAITGYTVISNPGGLTGTGTASPITVTGLTNGTAYTFTVTATNAVGTGPASSASNSITPVAATTVPGAPTIGTATAGNSQATITFTAPANDGGSAITGYTVISNPGGLTETGTASPITVTGLTNGTEYTFTVTATNAVGTGPASTASNSIIPVAATTVPGAPTIGTATAGNSQATITFTAPANDGGSAITGYTVISNPGGFTGTGTASPITVTGLTNGTAYTFTVTATNAVGTGPASSASSPITPVAPPTATTTTATSVTNTSATLNGTVNANNLSTTITFEYGLTTSYGSTTSASPSPVTGNISTSVSATITGLSIGSLYHYRIKAVNAGGTTYGSDLTLTTLQPPTASTNSATSVAATSATLNGSVNPNNLSTVVTFEYGTSTSYGSTIVATQSPLSGTSSMSVSAPVTGLISNTTYHYRVKATNIYGTTYGSDRSFTTPVITENLTSTKDCFVSSETPDLSYGTSASLSFYSDANGVGIGYIYFNLSSIPSGSAIEEATLKLYVTSINSIGDIYIARANGTWSESLTYNTSSRPGHISPNVWSKPSVTSQWWNIDVKSIITEWITNGSSNNGFYIWATSGAVIVNSRETSYKPTLTIKY